MACPSGNLPDRRSLAMNTQRSAPACRRPLPPANWVTGETVMGKRLGKAPAQQAKTGCLGRIYDVQGQTEQLRIAPETLHPTPMEGVYPRPTPVYPVARLTQL